MNRKGLGGHILNTANYWSIVYLDILTRALTRARKKSGHNKNAIIEMQNRLGETKGRLITFRNINTLSLFYVLIWPEKLIST